MKIVIAGSGAMGTRFGVMLHRAGNEVVLIDSWEPRIKAIQEDGVRGHLNGEELNEQIPMYSNQEIPCDFSPDLVVFLTKALDLEKMVQDVLPMFRKDTMALSLLNGIGHQEVLKKYLDLENIFIGNTMWTAGLESADRVMLFGNGSVTLQNLGEGKEKEAKHIVKILSEAGLNAAYSDDIFYTIYKKACVNGTMNGLCTLLDVNMAGFGETTPAKIIVTKVISEFVAVASREGVVMSVPEMVEYVSQCYQRETIGEHYPSTHQDLIKDHRLTEIDYINGAIARKGTEYGISTPYCELITQLVHCKEEILAAT